MNIAHINICTEAEGPYRRMAIWFQGCDILCEGCCNPELHPIKVAHIMTIKEVIDLAKKSREENDIEGVTFLGGEPTLQEWLKNLAQALEKENFGTILFTGRSINDLDEDLKASVDLIVDGKFDLKQIDSERNLIGSKNQSIYLITDRYKECLSWFYETREKRIEINIGQDVQFLVTGDVI